VVDVLAEPERLAAGLWFVVADFEGRVRAWQFEHDGEGVPPATGEIAGAPWQGPASDAWRSSMSREEYCRAVESVRARIFDGDVYQVNVCRVLSAPWPARRSGPDGPSPHGVATHGPGPHEARALAEVLAAGNPAPFGGHVAVDGDGAPAEARVWVVSASPELFVRLDGATVVSAPIKGTATEAGGLLDKDRAENVMITDLVRNDLQRVCVPGSVRVPALLALEQHPGLVHLVSTVTGELEPGLLSDPARWRRLLGATFPPGSVSGAPKEAALGLVAALEPVPRGPYCGAVGWVDADAGRAELAVGIRTFWSEPDETGDHVLRFGTGAGITWESDPEAEWEETRLKARRLVALASQASTDGRLEP